MQDIVDTIKARAVERLPWDWLSSHGITEGYFAGGGLLRAKPNDIDLFPVEGKNFKPDTLVGRVASTNNADTYRVDEVTVQLCSYKHTSLVALVESFDFAHIKVGVRFMMSLGASVLNCSIEEVYVSPDFKSAHEAETSYFTGSEYPLSSLIRLVKYAKRDIFAGKSYLPVMMDILLAILDRGFNGYDDFKDQLDAVDLGYLEDGLNRDTLIRIFKHLDKEH